MIIELITVLASAGVLAGLGKFLRDEYLCWKQRHINKSNSKNLNNDKKIFENLIDIGQEFDFNYSHIFSLHNSGKVLTNLSKKKISLHWEFRKAHILPSKFQKWNDRKASCYLKKFISELDTDDFIYFSDVSDLIEKDSGVLEIYNLVHGKEMIFIKMGWTENDKFLFGAFQRDKSEFQQPLNIRQQAFIKYKCDELAELIKL